MSKTIHLDWNEPPLTPEDIRTRLEEERPSLLEILHIPNVRIQGEHHYLKQLFKTGTESRQDLAVTDLQQFLAEQQKPCLSNCILSSAFPI